MKIVAVQPVNLAMSILFFLVIKVLEVPEDVPSNPRLNNRRMATFFSWELNSHIASGLTAGYHKRGLRLGQDSILDVPWVGIDTQAERFEHIDELKHERRAVGRLPSHVPSIALVRAFICRLLRVQLEQSVK
ncbi:MAG: hypothetical protein GTO18_16980 [Anaerolineales bacterium]|nr:hypothetical protein [Anaerolineales bacterium]